MDKLIEEYAQGPNVNFVIVGGAKEHFWGHVLIGAAESGAWGVDVIGGPAKIAEFNVKMAIQEQVLRLH